MTAAVHGGVPARAVDRRFRALGGLFWVAAVIVALRPAPAACQTTEPITAAPPNIIVPNYNGVPTGPLGGLEGNASVARATDTSAPWFNPGPILPCGHSSR